MDLLIKGHIAKLWALLVLLVFGASCRQSITDSQSKATIDSTTVKLDSSLPEKPKTYPNETLEMADTDSIWLEDILKEALNNARSNLAGKGFTADYEVSGQFVVRVSIMVGNFFTKTSPHVIIRRGEPGYVHLDIYSITNGAFTRILSHEEWSLVHVNDTLMDVNGDRVNDLVVNWYGSTGCCLKAFSNVYLMRPNDGSFTEMYTFINPTFSPKEKVIRGVCYGHPGETEMYKYQWNGEQVDTLEYIFFEKDSITGEKTGKVVVSDKRPHLDPKRIKKMKSVPKEYTTIEGFHWFMGW